MLGLILVIAVIWLFSRWLSHDLPRQQDLERIDKELKEAGLLDDPAKPKPFRG